MTAGKKEGTLRGRRGKRGDVKGRVRSPYIIITPPRKGRAEYEKKRDKDFSFVVSTEFGKEGVASPVIF